MISGTRPSNSVRNRTLGPQGVPADRRRRRNLRELCDEVLASYRVAAERDVISEADRQEARAIMARVAPIFAK